MGVKKLINVVKKQDRSIREIYEKYLKHCISIGQAHGTIESKKQFFRYSLPKIVNVDDSITTFTKHKLEEHIIFMRKAGGEWLFCTYVTFINFWGINFF
ncbi:hypothetical protein [Clostridium ljungdahlii]|uniref:Uncharacterized protein n=1 Tax=Clostridium ljungdahlii TaxID=1538 RepID=A0A168R8N9_9CLOT|nr:hypothetical protein [Clostridium ljungdahlii]OAA90348.1 hypothetical protein WY13_01251 [Clostridium ljungdahlii]